MTMNLTSQMAQLRLNINSLRDARASFLRNLASDRAALAATVSQMQEGFQTARADMADKLQHDLHAFTSHLRQHVVTLAQNVAAQRGEIAGDLAGASAAWRDKPRRAARSAKTYAAASAPRSAAPRPTTVAPKSRKSKRY